MKKLYIIPYVFFLIVLTSLVSGLDDTDLANCYDFEQTSGNLIDQVGGVDSYSDVVEDKSAIGIIGGGWELESGELGYINISNMVISGKGEFSVVMWVKFESLANTPYLFSYVDSAAQTSLTWNVGEGAYRVYATGGGTEAIFREYDHDPITGVWYMLTYTYSDINNFYYLYVNASEPDGTDEDGALPTGGSEFGIGNAFPVPSSGNSLDAIVDEVRIYNISLTIANITEIYNEGVGLTCAGEGLAPPLPPVIVPPSPADNSNNNTNVSLVVNHTTSSNDVRYYLYFGSSTPLTEDHLYIDNETRTGDEYKSFLTNVTDGVYYWKYRVQNVTDGQFSTNTTERTLTIDTVSPTITLGGNHNISIANNTIISNYLYNLSINVSFYDSNLAGGQTLINITNESGQSSFQILNTSITGTTANYTKTIDISNWSIGNYTLQLIVTDSHTSDLISDYDVQNGINTIEFNTPEGNRIWVSSDGSSYLTLYNKKQDRYEFGWNYLLKDTERTFTIRAKNKISYLPDSEYIGHFVIVGDDSRGNWIDFEGIGKDYSVKKISDFEYEIAFINLPDDNKIISKSLGGLNRVQKDYSFKIGAVYNIWVHEDENNNPINATVTLDSQVKHTISSVSPAILQNVTKEDISIIINSTGYGSEAKTINSTVSFHNKSFNLTVVSAVKIYFYDESTVTLIGGETFTTYLETTGFSQTYSATTNPYTISGLANGLYKLKASSTNYPERQILDVNISNATTTNINIYFINSTDSAEKTFNIVSADGLAPLEDVFVVFTRIINGTRTIIAEEESDYAGQVKIDLDENYEYTINFSKTNYEDKEISLEPTESEYLIQMISTVGAYNVSVYEGIRYKFEPSNTVLNNNTEYSFTFTLNSSTWPVTNCTLKLYNGTTDLLNQTSSYTSNSCYLRIELNTASMTNITSEARYELNSLYNFTVSQQYRVIYTYEGEFSLKNFLDDLSDFGMAGFDDFGRMMLALIVIFVITALAAQKIGFTNPEVLIFLVIVQVWFFSYVNWLYLDFAPIPTIAGFDLKKYIIAILISLAGGAFVMRKFTE